MSETSVFSARAVVYFYDANKKNWAPTEVAGFCRMDMYFNPGTNAYRVIARGLENPNQVVINSNVTKDTQYAKASATFHQWTDAKKTVWGYNFGTQEDADTFARGFEDTLKKLASPAAAAPAPAPAPAKVAPQAPAAPKGPPQPPAAPKGPPAPPAAPKAPAGGGGAPQERGALLSSIQGFSSAGLKKAVTVDKSAPIVGPEPGAAAARAGPSDGGSGGGGGAAPPARGGDMMSEMMAKRNAMKKAGGDAPAAAAPKVAAPSPSPKVAAPTPKAAVPVPSPNRSGSAAPAPNSAVRAVAAAVLSPSAPSGDLSPELEALKNEILAEVRAEILAAKNEILAAIRQR